MAAKGDSGLNALHRVVAMFENLNDLSKQQSAVIKFFTFGMDTFVSLPTAHGKSLIFQPYRAKESEGFYSIRPGFKSVS